MMRLVIKSFHRKIRKPFAWSVAYSSAELLGQIALLRTRLQEILVKCED
jgi:hypothetical protein